MERAFQHQVIYGGCIDTILLEMGLIPEERLVQYLSLATGLPPATRKETEAFDPAAGNRCSLELAQAYRVVPLCFDRDALRVLVHDPVDLTLLEELANELELPIQPLIVPEYRFHIVFNLVFGRSTPARFLKLAEKLNQNPSDVPVGKARTIIVDNSMQEPRSQPPASADKPRRTTMVFSTAALAERHRSQPPVGAAGPRATGSGSVPQLESADARSPGGGTEQPGSAAAPAVTRPRAATDPTGHAATAAAPAIAPAAAPTPVAAPAPVATTPQPVRPASAAATTAPAPAPVRPAPVPAPADPAGARPGALRPASAGPGGATPAGAAPPVARGPAPTGQVQTRPASTSLPVTGAGSPPLAADPGAPGSLDPLTAQEARSQLLAAAERDAIFELLLRAIRGRAPYAGLLTVQGNAAVGRIALVGDQREREQIGSVLVPLDAPSAFKQVVASASPYIGPIAAGEPALDDMLRRMGGVVPAAAMLLPIVLRNRVVAIAVGHRGREPISVTDVAELLPLASATADALSRIIMQGKSVGYRSSSADAPAPEVNRSELPRSTTPDRDRDEARSGWSVPTSPAAVPAPAPELVPPPAAAPPRRSPAELLAAIEAAESEVTRDPLLIEAVTRAAELLPLLEQRFPGPLLIARRAAPARSRARQHGPLLDLVVRLGAASGNLLVRKLRDPDRAVRYYAALCCSELRPRSALPVLVERLFDAEPGVRALAVVALRGYPPEQLGMELAPVRNALVSTDPQRCQAAASALAELGDAEAVPDLIEVYARNPGAAYLSRALVDLTKQDFGSSVRKWRAWWDKNQQRHRIEWLIDALTHKDDQLRQSAASELRALTGEQFGYAHDLPRREREQARQRWLTWWNDTGQRRFLVPERAERQRPTAVLPRRD
jgi:hypothetical protein